MRGYRHLLLTALTLALSCAVSACAPAIPVFGAATTTPQGRGDFTLGGAARVGLGDLDPSKAPPEVARYVAGAQGSGVAPAGAFRYGVGEHTDLGVTVAGPAIRLDVRQELVLADDLVRIVLLGGVGPYVGWWSGEDDGENGNRVGVDVPLVIGVDALSFLQLYLGARVGIEHAWGELGAMAPMAPTAAASATGFRVGGIFGLAFGFRHLHLLLELSAGYETWSGEIGATAIGVDGAVLTPAFALRYRL